MSPSQFLMFEILERVVLFTFGAVFTKLVFEGSLEAAALVSFATLTMAAFCIIANMKRQAAFLKQLEMLGLIGRRGGGNGVS